MRDIAFAQIWSGLFIDSLTKKMHMSFTAIPFKIQESNGKDLRHCGISTKVTVGYPRCVRFKVGKTKLWDFDHPQFVKSYSYREAKQTNCSCSQAPKIADGIREVVKLDEGSTI